MWKISVTFVLSLRVAAVEKESLRKLPDGPSAPFMATKTTRADNEFTTIQRIQSVFTFQPFFFLFFLFIMVTTAVRKFITSPEITGKYEHEMDKIRAPQSHSPIL